MKLSDLQIGSRVEFHGEWPFIIYYGTVKSLGTRKRELGNATEEYAVIEWDDCPYVSKQENSRNKITSVPLWNNRLKISVT